MFQMRREHMDAFERSAHESFHWRLAALCRRLFPRETAGLDEDQLYAHVRTAAARAVGYGIESQAGVTRFVGLTFLVDPRFDERSPIREILTRKGADVERAVEVIVSMLPGAIEAARTRDGLPLRQPPGGTGR